MKLKYKLIIWHVVVAGLAWGLWGYVDYVLNVITPESFDFDYEPLPLANFLLQAGLIVIGFVLFSEKKWGISLAGIVGLMYLARFGFSYLSLIGVGAFMVLALNSRISAIQEIEERTKVNPRLILRRGTPALIIGMFILASFAAYQSPVAKTLSQTDRLPSASETFIRKVVNTTLSSKIEEIDQSQREQALSQVTGETINSINTIIGPYFQYAPPALAFGLFLVLWGLSWIFIWASVGMGMVVFWGLKKIGFITIEKKDVKAETLII
jgi:hypothetical protein